MSSKQMHLNFPAIKPFKRLALALALAFCLASILPSVAQAATSVSLDTANKVINVATVYETSPNTQNQVLSFG